MPHYQEPPLQMGPVGANIFRVRRKLRITQKQLAAPEFSISYISAIERGRIRPSLKALDILSRRLGVTSAELLAELPEGYEVPDDYGAEPAPPSQLSLVQLVGQRRSVYPVPLALGWATIALGQGDAKLADELLQLLTPNTLTPEQHLLYRFLLAQVYLATGRPNEARIEMEQVLKQEEFRSHNELLLRCRLVLAHAYEQQGQALDAGEQITAVVQAVEKRTISDPLFASKAYIETADHYRYRERREEAAEFYERALYHMDTLEQPGSLAQTSAQLAQEHLAGGRTLLSDWYSARSRALLEMAEERQQIARAAIHLGTLQQAMGDTLGAERQLRRALALCEHLGAPQLSVQARLDLAEVLLLRKEPQEAERLALEADGLCRRGAEGVAGDHVLHGRALLTLGSAQKALNRLEEADQTFKRAIELLKVPQATEYLAQAYHRYGELLNQRGQFAEGYELAKQAYLLR